MSPKKAKVHVGRNLRNLREKKGWSQRELSKRLPVHQSTYSRWEGEGEVPRDQIEAVAEVLETSIDELSEDVAADRGETNDSYVFSPEDLMEWSSRISSADVADEVVVLLVALTMFIDKEETWLVMTTPEAMAERTGRDLEMIESNWGDMLETPYVERVSPAEYVLRLALPENEDGGN